MQVSESTVSVPGGVLYAKQWSTPANSTGAPLVLFHDSLGCVEMWRAFPEQLARETQRRVIAYDRLGFGRSTPRQDIPSAQFVSDEASVFFEPLREHFRFERCVLFGHSVGGGMAVSVAARYPEVCQAVVTESAQGFVEDKTWQAIAAAKEKFASPQEILKLERFHGARARWVVDAWTKVWLSDEFAHWTVEEDLAQVTCPLLAIHGENDDYGSLAFPRMLTSGTSGPTRMVILPGGHVPHREHERLVLDAVRDFVVNAAA